MRLDTAWIFIVLCAALGGCQTTANTTTSPTADAQAAGPKADASHGPANHEAGIAPADAGVEVTLDATTPQERDASEAPDDAASDTHDVDAGVGDAAHPPPACTVTTPTACPTPMPTYADVEPIFRQRCVVCHAPTSGGPWPLNEYQDVSDWQTDIRTDLLSCSMPPPDAGLPLPPEESMQILSWLRCGLPK